MWLGIVWYVFGCQNGMFFDAELVLSGLASQKGVQPCDDASR